MIIAVAKLAIKVGRSKTTRRVVRKAVKVAKENVSVDTAARAIDLEVAGRTYRIDRSTFKREVETAVVPASIEYDPFA